MWSKILNECNYLSWKIVKYCILYEVCMIKTAPHSTLSPKTWCIKKYKRLVCTHPDLLARICKVNLLDAKNLTWFVFQEFVFLIYCDQEPLLLLNVTEDYFLGLHSRLSTLCKIYLYTLKSLSLSLKSHMNVSLS